MRRATCCCGEEELESSAAEILGGKVCMRDNGRYGVEDFPVPGTTRAVAYR